MLPSISNPQGLPVLLGQNQTPQGHLQSLTGPLSPALQHLCSPSAPLSLLHVTLHSPLSLPVISLCFGTIPCLLRSSITELKVKVFRKNFLEFPSTDSLLYTVHIACNFPYDMSIYNSNLKFSLEISIRKNLPSLKSQ